MQAAPARSSRESEARWRRSWWRERRKLMVYLSQAAPKTTKPNSHPRRYVVCSRGTFQWLEHTRSHCEARVGGRGHEIQDRDKAAVPACFIKANASPHETAQAALRKEPFLQREFPWTPLLHLGLKTGCAGVNESSSSLRCPKLFRF